MFNVAGYNKDGKWDVWGQSDRHTEITGKTRGRQRDP